MISFRKAFWVLSPPTLAIVAGFPMPLHGESSAPHLCSPALEEAAEALAQSRLETAYRRFLEAAQDPSTPTFARGLALAGVAETAKAQGKSEDAREVWRQLAADESIPHWQRQLAQRRALETGRALKGLPERDPALYRVKLPSLAQASMEFHVSPNTSEAAADSKSRTFATLEQARDAVRALKKSRGGTLPRGGVRVTVHDGFYRLNGPFALGPEDSGTADAPVSYVARRAGSAVFGGGSPVGGWRAIAGDEVRHRLNPAVAGKVLEADLRANGITDWGDPVALKKRPELFADGVPQTLARWPDGGFVKTGDVLGTNTFKVWGTISGCKDGKFRYVEDRATNWVQEPDVRLYGYWFWDWFEEYQKVASIDVANRSFTLSQPYSNYGYRKGQRYYAVNVLGELDQPGEWYLDREAGRVYWLPPEKLNLAKARLVLSLRSEPFVTFDNVQHVQLVGLTFQEGRGDGIRVMGGSDCLIAGCTLRRLGGDALIVDGGLRHIVFGCVMHTLGCGGMRVNGGNRQALSRGDHVVENCVVSDISRLKRTYAPAVHLDGCGNRVAHNLFERIPSSAMRIEGNDHLVELNHIRNVVQESDDQGGVDMFGNPLYRGVVIRWNRWSDIKGGTECGAAGIRLDDMISGTVVYGNLFERCGAVLFGGVQIHGGKENVVDGNVFVDCHAGISFSRWGESRWLTSVEPFLKQATSQPYASRYPDLARIKTEPDVNFISRNLLFGCRNVYLRDGGLQKTALLGLVGGPPPASFLKKGSATEPAFRRVLLEPLPLAEIGPYPHRLKLRL